MIAQRTIGRYTLFDPIAAGGMATVHLGRLMGPVGFSRTVAIKRLHAQFARDPEFVAMFLDEARLAGRIRHPNVVSTLDVVVLDAELLVVMDYVHGEAVSRLIRHGGPVPQAIACTVLAGALYGLHAAHEASADDGSPLEIVHRDVSPQNILVGADGLARVVDFGVAKAVGRLQTTREGTIKGKLSYMSPEQIAADAVDRRTDIYAASVVLWEMLTGRRLFDADSDVRKMHRVLHGEVLPPSTLLPVDPALDALVMRGLSRHADARFATAHEMAEALQSIAMATPGQVAEWMKRGAGETLEERTRQVAEVERSGGVASPTDEEMGQLVVEDDVTSRTPPAAHPPPLPSSPFSPPSPSSGVSPADSQVSAVNVSSGAGPGALGLPRGRLVAVAVGSAATVTALVLVVGLSLARRDAVDPTVTTAGGSADPVSALTAAPLSVEPARPAPVAAASASASPATAAPTPASLRPTATPARPATAAPPAVNCTPPYTLKNGIRMPKMECL